METEEIEDDDLDQDDNLEIKSKKEKKTMKKERKKRRILSKLNGASKPRFNPLDKLNSMETKNNVSNSMVKMLVDTVACLFIAPAVSAVSGKYAPLVGGAINFSGHYVGDQSGLLRAVGMGTMVHGMAKVNEYRSEDSTIKTRFGGIKDDWLKCFLNKEPESKKNELINSEIKSLEPSVNQNEVSGIPTKKKIANIDISLLDLSEFENLKDQKNTKKNDTFEDSSTCSFNSNHRSEEEQNNDFDDDDIDFSRY